MKQLLFIVLFCTGLELFGVEYAVVASRELDAVSLGQIRAIFLKKNSFVGAHKVVPLNLSSRNKIRMSFEKNVLKMPFSKLKSYWTKQHYLGHRPPITLKSQKSIKAFLQRVDYAIGYMELNHAEKDFKILYKWSE